MSGAGHRRRVAYPSVRLLALVVVVAAGMPARALAGRVPDAATTLVVGGDPIASVAASSPVGSLYAVGSAALYRSDDGGLSWKEVGPPPPATPIVVGEGEPDVLLVGDPPGCASGIRPPIFRSADGGGSWAEVPGAEGLRPVAVWPERGLALGIDCTSLLVSVDAASSWSAGWRHPSRDITSVATVAEPWRDDGVVPEAFVVVTSEGGGSSLVPIDLADPTAPRDAPSVRDFWGLGAVAFVGGRLALGTAMGVWVSDDAGATWRGGRAGLEEVTFSVDPSVEPIPESESGRRLGVDAVAIGPPSTDRLYAGTIGGLFVSEDGGGSWARVPSVDVPVLALTVAASSHQLFVETETAVVVVPL